MEINTAQNVYLSQEKAGIGERFLAILIDLVIITGIIITTSLITQGTDAFNYVIIFNGILLMLYHFLAELLFNGQSLGKNILQIRIVDVSGENAGFYQYLIRNLLRPIDYFLGLGLAFMIFNKKGQRIGDISAGTYAVKINKEVNYLETAYIELTKEYKPKYKRFQVERLNAQHIELIKTVLNDSKKNLRYETVGKLYFKVCSIMQIEQDEQTRMDFLETVIRDFNFYQL
jgi:uncharacterized RDD family membrane protein YckC